VTLLNESASSSASNRMALGGNLTISAKQAAILRYDGTAVRWQAIAGGAGTSGRGIVPQPQGRLTLQSGVPVMTATQSSKATLYYTPYVGNQIPLYDGTNMVPTAFSELSVATTDTTKNPAAIGASKVNDWFVWNDGGTLRLTHGPDWTNDTTRSASTALTMVNGILLNNAIITNGPATSRGTYVGTTRSNGSSQLDWIFGASGTAPWFGVWNMYNRVDVRTVWCEGTASWAYGVTTIRALNASSIARVSLVRGLNEDAVSVLAQTYIDTNPSSTANFGLGLDSTTVNTVQMQATGPSVAGIGSVQYAGLPGVGFHYIQQTEKFGGSSSYTAYGISILSSITFSGRM
jgi:hypothetical protein